jgi:uncharacterized protein (DUF885 family)
MLDEDSGPERSIEGVDAFVARLQELQDRTIGELDGRHFDIPAPIKRIEVKVPPPGGALAPYYTPPSEDFARPGRFWHPVGKGMRFPLWSKYSLSYHEGVPGHHLQVAQAKYLAGELSRFQRFGASISGYGEGWAMYAEVLMGELGYLDQPEHYLGMLQMQIFRAARVIVDIGLHLELPIPAALPGESFHRGETWTPALALEFLTERGHAPAELVASEVVRYLGWPAQAISYKVGERLWLQARADARRRHGAAFDLKRFHAQALALGPMGLDQMQRELARI